MDLTHTATQTYSMFIFDDREQIKDCMVNSAKASRFRVHSAHNRSRALRCVKNNIYDSYCLDIAAPWHETFGFDLMAIALKKNPSATISVITGHNEFQERSFQIGADLFFAKPIKKPDVICSQIRETISKKHDASLISPAEIDSFLIDTVSFFKDNPEILKFFLSFFGTELPELTQRIDGLEFIARNSEEHIKQALKMSTMAQNILDKLDD